jgi:hypothetical protein
MPLSRARARALLPFASLALALGAGGLACSSTDKMSGVADARLPSGARVEALEHEACDESGNRVEVLDTNGDGKADIRRIYNKASGREACRIVDLNKDGKPDMFEYFDHEGVLRRRELCFDETGVVNAIEHYEGGKLTKREYDTSGQHRIDTWDYFEPDAALDAKTGRPRPSKRERDLTGDGRVDQWWTWEGDKVTIATDRSGDGKPDPESTIVLGGGDDAGLPPATPSGSGDAGAADGAATSSAPSDNPPPNDADASASSAKPTGASRGAKKGKDQ